jgi:hypothetical protein
LEIVFKPKQGYFISKLLQSLSTLPYYSMSKSRICIT